MKNKIKARISKIGQLIYLTFYSYRKNVLYESASSCAFGFLLSFIPILMMIASILSGVINAYPSILTSVLDYVEEFSTVFDIKPLILEFSNIKSLSWVDIILALWVIWMARRLFYSIAAGISKIFHSITPQKGYVIQIMTFLGELILIIGIISIILALFMLRQIFSMTIFEALAEKLPYFINLISKFITASVFYIIIFAFTTVVYRFESRTKPRLNLCILCAGLFTISFWGFSLIYNLFMDFSRYNLIYGTISTIIILMMKVYTFFLLFFLFAQLVYNSQFFSELLFGQLYLFSEKRNSVFIEKIKSQLFLRTNDFTKNFPTFQLEAGQEFIFDSTTSLFVYYVLAGEIIQDDGSGITHCKGDFFGEKNCFFSGMEQVSFKAKTDCKLLKIDTKTFKEFLEKNPSAATAAIKKLS